MTACTFHIIHKDKAIGEGLASMLPLVGEVITWPWSRNKPLLTKQWMVLDRVWYQDGDFLEVELMVIPKTDEKADEELGAVLGNLEAHLQEATCCEVGPDTMWANQHYCSPHDVWFRCNEDNPTSCPVGTFADSILQHMPTTEEDDDHPHS